jgi:RND superfamily putative drug exporter
MSTAEPAHATPSRTRQVLRWLLPAAIVLVWLAVGGPLGSFAGQLSEVQSNDNASFLPASAESTRVNEIAADFTEQELLPAVVVWEFDEPVTEEQLGQVASQAGELADVSGVVGEPSPPIPAEDGQAVQVVVPLDADGGERLATWVEEMRGLVDGIPGADVYVTGPAGVLADFTEAFGEIDGLLLVVALSVVLLILLVVYRSPILPFVVLVNALLALGAASATVYALADAGVLTLNGQSQGILFILVVGAATDYSLLLVARYREELRDHASRFTAIRKALRGAVEPIVASGVTVILGLLALLFSDLNSNRGLGPVASIGIAFSMLAALTFLPAALVLLGRAAFWPFRPAYGSPHSDVRGIWAAVARLVGRRARLVWIVTAIGLGALAAFLPAFRADGVSQTDFFLTSVESVEGQEALARHFPAGSGSPAQVVAPEAEVAAVLEVVSADPGVAEASPQVAGPPGSDAEPVVVDGEVLVDATLVDQADSEAAEETVRRLRVDLDEVSSEALVGGQTALQLDTTETARRDLRVIIPIVLATIFVVLALLLRSLVAPLVLLVANVLSFAATIGAAAIVFNEVLDWPGSDPAVPLYAFVFLVALGIDYSIFLTTRVREESIKCGTRPGILKGLAVTGGVITSAGIVLAATFSALAVLPILFLAQIAFLVAFGVLLDTLVVRSLLVPALAYDIGPRFWWPSRLSRESAAVAAPPSDEPEPVTVR